MSGERVLTIRGNRATRPLSEFARIPIGIGDVYYVDSGSGSDTAGGKSPEKALATLDAAIGKCTANQGDIIYILPGHAETVATAGAIAADVAGVSIIGLGEGADRPTFTFSAVDATWIVSAASTTIKNMLIKPSIDSVVSPIVVSAANCIIDVEVQDATALIECVSAILTTSLADNLDIRLKYRGFLAGNACVSPIRLVGVDTARIYVDFYGVASTAVVEFLTTSCHDIDITGLFYNNGTTLSKNVVDTAGSSTWSIRGWDGNSNANFSGGDNAALASAAIPQCVVKTGGTVENAKTDALFVISGGPVRCKITGVVGTIIGGASSVKLQITTDSPVATGDLSAGAVDIDSDAVGTIYQNVGASSVFTPSTTLGYTLTDPVTVEETEFTLTPGTVKLHSTAAQTGAITWYMTYIPMSPLSVVTAAA